MMIKRILIFCVGTLILGTVCSLAQTVTNSPDMAETRWFNLLLNQKKTGHFAYQQSVLHKGNSKMISRWEKFLLKINRGHEIITVVNKTHKYMNADGKLLSFHHQSQQDQASVQLSGVCDYRKGVVFITHSRNDTKKEVTIDIVKSALTDYQALSLLKSRGWHVGDFIRYTNLMAEKGIYIKIKMKLAAIEQKSPAHGGATIYKIVRTIEDMPHIKSISWVDEALKPYKGELLFPHLKYTLEPTTMTHALNNNNSVPAVLELAKIKLKHCAARITRENRAKIEKAIFRVKLKRSVPFPHHIQGGLQRITEGNLSEGLQLVIDTDIPKNVKDAGFESHSEALQDFLKANMYIESDNEGIVRLACRLKVKDKPWLTALAIKKWVHENVLMRFDTGFASAAQVLNSRRGDCTEHSLLTAALCRACDIPSRLVFGYALSIEEEGEPAFVGHMWSEVFIGGIWIPIDSTNQSPHPVALNIRFFSTSLDNCDLLKTSVLFPLTNYLEISLMAVHGEGFLSE